MQPASARGRIDGSARARRRDIGLIARALACLGAVTLLSGCFLFGDKPFDIDVSGGLPVSTCDENCMRQREADEAAAAAARERSAAEAARVQDLIDKRTSALGAVNNAIGDFIHRSPPGSMTDPNSSIADWAHSLRDLRGRLESAPLDDVQRLYDEARSQLDGAYNAAVRAGMFDPRTVGQRNASETWWYISS